MIRCVDTNVLVAAFNPHHPHHGAANAWLNDAAHGDSAVVLLDEVAASFLRVTTDARIWATPAAPGEAFDFVESLIACPAVHFVTPSPHRWTHFRALATAHALAGPDLPDALIAAAAVELNATVVTFDRRLAAWSEGELLR